MQTLERKNYDVLAELKSDLVLADHIIEAPKFVTDYAGPFILRHADWTESTYADIRTSPLSAPANAQELLDRYKLARKLRSSVQFPVHLAATVASSELVVDSASRQLLMDGHIREKVDRAIHSIFGNSARHGMADWQIRDIRTVADDMQRGRSAAVTATMGDKQSRDLVAQAAKAIYIENLSFAQLRSYLDQHGLPMEDILDIQRRLPLRPAMREILKRARDIIEDNTMPARLMQHNHWPLVLQHPEQMNVELRKALLGFAEASIDGAASATRMRLGYFATARMLGLSKHDAHDSMLAHSASFALEEARKVSHEARFLMRSRGLNEADTLDNVDLSQYNLAVNTLADAEEAQLIGKRVVFPEHRDAQDNQGSLPNIQNESSPVDQSERGRCTAAQRLPDLPEWVQDRFSNMHLITQCTYDVVLPPINTAVELAMLNTTNRLTGYLSEARKMALDELESFYNKLRVDTKNS